ncbi:MAG: hypothetical protein ACOZCO_00045 [Bacteroidota bacterium]
MANRIFIAVIVLLCFSCGNDEQSAKGKLLAKVGDKELFLSDLQGMIPEGLTPDDSIARVKAITDDWIRETVILNKAETELPETKKNVEARLEKYRRSLLIYEYEKEYARQKLDTNVSDQEIEKHYLDNQQDFKLPDYIVKVLYVKVMKEAPAQDKVARWFKSTRQEDLLSLEKYSAANAVNYYNDTESWIYFNELLKEVPLTINNKDEFLKNNKHVTFEDEEFKYYLTIYEYKLKDALSPLSLEKDNIKARILNARTTELIKKMRTDIMNESSGEIKNYLENEE